MSPRFSTTLGSLAAACITLALPLLALTPASAAPGPSALPIASYVGLAASATPAATGEAAPSLAGRPTISFGTYLGGRSADTLRAVAADSTGIYVVGETYSDDIAGLDGRLRGNTDIYVARLNAAGTQLIWGAYLGGGANEDGYGVALDGKGGVWVVGASNSQDFPTTPDAIQGLNGGGYDAVIARLSIDDGALLYGSYFGLENGDEARSIVPDGLGSMLIAGQGGDDVMVLKIEAESYNMVYGGFFGGTGEDGGYAVAAGPRGYAFITGATDGPGSTVDFPLIEPLQSQCGRATDAGSCGQDAFVTAITPDGKLVYSTLLGGSFAGSSLGSGGDIGKAIAVDAQGNIYVAGETYASDFPVKNAAQATKAGADTIADGFLVKIAFDGKSLLYATYLGGTQYDEVRSLVVDGQGNAIVAGISGSKNFPVKDALQSQLGDGVCGIGGTERFCEDAVVAKFGPAGELVWSTYLGGGLDDYGYSLAIDPAGGLLVTGSAASSTGQGFPATPGALQPAKALQKDGFVLRLGDGATPPPPPAELSFRTYLPLVRR